MFIRDGLLAGLVVSLALSACDAPMITLPDVGGPSQPKLSGLQGGVHRVPPRDLVPIVRREALRYGLEPEAVLGLIAQESAFNAKAVSTAGALGLMQQMPETVADLNTSGAGMRDPFNAAQNIAGGCLYLRQLHDSLADVNPRYRWAYTLAAYNGGIGRLRRAMKVKGGQQATYATVAPLLPQETQGYVPAVLRYQSQYATMFKAAAAPAPRPTTQARRTKAPARPKA
ncbi:MAG: transglycosylase SLT domain-containing protein [Candidatus Sericytochromatia bacterium]|nr:transglycosylase SLT domain-containing protein [Candidatus Sericytochromatia bacterium]